MKHQTNMRGREALSRIPQVPFSAIFGNAFSPALGNGLRITDGHETHCRTYSNRNACTLASFPRLTVTRGDKAQSPNSSRKVNRIHLGKALIAVPATDRQSPFYRLVRHMSRVRQGDGLLFSSSHRGRPALSIVVRAFEHFPSRKADVNECHFLSLSDLSQEQKSIRRLSNAGKRKAGSGNVYG